MTKGEATKRAIVSTALAEASRVGLEGLSIGGLAKSVGLSKSGLFAHFESKANLQLEVLRHAVERFIQEVIGPALERPRGLPRLRALFELWLDWSKASSLPGGCLFVSSATELDDRPGPLRDYLVSAQEDWLGVLATAARIAVEEGQLRRDLDPHQLAYDVYSIILAYHHFKRLLRNADAEDRARRSFERLVDGAAA